VSLGRPHQPDAPLNIPLTPATSFLAGRGPGYSRAGNPTWEPLEEIVGSLEAGRAIAFGSGMAAIAATFEVLLAHSTASVPTVAAPGVHYSGSRLLLAELARRGRINLRSYRAESGDLGALDVADIVLVETPANPTMEITDIAAITASAGALVICDNTYATPLATRPLELGVDIVVHSASKYFAGHSDALLGVAVTADPALADQIVRHRTLHGAVPGVLEAWLATRGLRTLPVRFAAACANANLIASRLALRGDVVQVRYPGLADDPGHAVAARQMDAFGAMITFRPAGGDVRAEAITGATRLWLHATSLGGVESTLERRRRHIDESPDTPDDLVRLSVGCEEADDLWADLAGALDATAHATG
jgi:cystathionine gamma-synthase